MKKWLTWPVAGLMLVLLAGCAAGPGTGPILSSGIPRDKYLIGSSYYIYFKAPQNGTFYVVESSTGKALEILSVAAGEARDYTVTGITDEVMNAIGVKRSSLTLKYYFVPATAFPCSRTPGKEKPAK